MVKTRSSTTLISATARMPWAMCRAASPASTRRTNGPTVALVVMPLFCHNFWAFRKRAQELADKVRIYYPALS